MKFDLPRSDVLEFRAERGKAIVRPSGTEPKLKLYLSARAGTMEQAAENCRRILSDLSDSYLR